MDLFVAVWSPRAAHDSVRVKRQTLIARRYDVPVLVVLLGDTPALPPWLEGAPTVPYEHAVRGQLRSAEGKVLGPWEES